MLLRLSPSDMEQWRLCDGELFGKSPKDFIAYLETNFESNDKIRVGSAFHKLVEHYQSAENFIEVYFDESGAECKKVFVTADGTPFEFNNSAVDLAAAMGELKGVNELRLSKTYELPMLGHSVYSEMVIDLAQGFHLYEFKTKTVTKEPTEYDFENSMSYYEESLQWRMYLDAMQGATQLTYIVCYLQVEKEDSTVIQGAYEPLTFSLQPYPQMQKDIILEMTGLVKFLEAHGKLHLIQNKK